MAGILRCGTVCGFKNSNTCIVVDIRSRGNSDPANTGSQGVRDVISVQVQCGDHIILSRASEDLLKEGICNHILDNNSIWKFAPVAAFQFYVTNLLHCNFFELFYKDHYS